MSAENDESFFEKFLNSAFEQKIVRCKNCIYSTADVVPYSIYCPMVRRTMDLDGYCYLGRKR